MSTWFNTKIEGNEFSLDFHTDNFHKYKLMEAVSRYCIDEVKAEQDKAIELSDLQKDMIVCFAKSSMNIAETARLMYRHYNTVVYQIGVIKERTGLDPRNFFDLVKLINLVNYSGGC